jgi:hypothetical protein
MTYLLKYLVISLQIRLGFNSTHISESWTTTQGCGSGSGSGSVLDPYSIGSVDPDPDSESGSGKNDPQK